MDTPKAPALPSCATPRYLAILVVRGMPGETSGCNGSGELPLWAIPGKTDRPLSLAGLLPTPSELLSRPLGAQWFFPIGADTTEMDPELQRSYRLLFRFYSWQGDGVSFGLRFGGGMAPAP